MNQKQKGFTLIELLIVITIIGILAVTGMSLLNPVEMIKRTQDGTAKTTARQVLDATVQAYLNDRTAYCNTCGEGALGACMNVSPETCGTDDVNIGTTPNAVSATITPFNNLVDLLEGTGLVKSSAKQSDLYESAAPGTNGYDVRVGFNYSDDEYEICFLPLSKAVKKEAGCCDDGTNTKDDTAVWTDGVCPANHHQCYLCIQ